MSFKKFNLNHKIVAGIQACKYVSPTPIQEQAIPAALKGCDLLGLAQTGTGKTAAFVLPILQHLLGGPRGIVRTLIVAPTRELAEQIHNSIEKMAVRTGLRSIAIYGGVSKSAQVKKIRSGVEIVVACPGRLLDHLGARTINLAKVEHLVLDEADHLFDMGFLPAIRSILKHLPRQRQTLLFSATMAKEIRKLAEEILVNPTAIQINYKQPTDTVSHVVFSVEQARKSVLLRKLIDNTDMPATLIFTRTKHKAKTLGQKLVKAGYKATSIQGNLSQSKRQQALDGFRSGKFEILVATDIAARGIDVTGISHVINYDMPDTLDAYTHRIGRTGRASATGQAYSFAGHEDRRMITMIEQLIGKKMARLPLGEEGMLAAHDKKEEGTFLPKTRAGRPHTGNKKRAHWQPKRTRSASIFGITPTSAKR